MAGHGGDSKGSPECFTFLFCTIVWSGKRSAASSHLHPNWLCTLLCRTSQLCPQLHEGAPVCQTGLGPAGPHTPCPGQTQEGEVGGGVCVAFVCLLRAREAETEVT